MMFGVAVKDSGEFGTGVHPAVMTKKVRSRIRIFMSSFYIYLNRDSPTAGGVFHCPGGQCQYCTGHKISEDLDRGTVQGTVILTLLSRGSLKKLNSPVK
jgi:hypothetical protein